MKHYGGVIVNMAMDMWNGFPGMSHSAAARAGVVNLTKTLGVEWAQSNVRVNCVAPGSSIVSPTAVANYGEERNVFQGLEVNIPAKRMGTVEEISSAVCFLLSPGAAFITGQTLRIDGGQSLYINSNTALPDSAPSDVYEWQSLYDSPSHKAVEAKAKL
ncbi:hypothetical protein EGW08_018591 [Elysia chlorotica]|uniref:Peroxisomal trans-2-enoyl-CoA reductase n=1 Tax=Elysia chlorotica TaxID=188477 RepID=A0A3S1BS59_ELYCH|nr:hypothetical protein EGW08_018591 [Elysia chlorotica]